jgi:hypothetical protein
MPTGIYKRTGTHRKLISEANKSRIVSDETKRKIGTSNKGKIRSEELKKKISIKISQNIGEKGSNWQGGCEPYWKQQALIRDHYTCVICHLYDPEIVIVDHIKPKSRFPELRKELTNLQTLCPNCHARKTLVDGRIYEFKRISNYKKI